MIDMVYVDRLKSLNTLLQDIYGRKIFLSDILRENKFSSDKIKNWKNDKEWIEKFLDELHNQIVYALAGELPDCEPGSISYKYGLSSQVIPTDAEIAKVIGVSEQKIGVDRVTILNFFRTAEGKNLLETAITESAEPGSHKAEPLTKREMDLLLSVFDYIQQHKPGSAPDNNWLKQRLGYTDDSAVVRLKKRLKDKGYLSSQTGDARLTFASLRLFKDLFFVPPVSIPVLGQVKAGRTKQDELVTIGDITDLNRGDLLSIEIPNTKVAEKVFALEVVGHSMQYEHILEGDYVIVRPFSENKGPEDGDLIICKYLPGYNVENADVDEVGWLDRLSDSDFEGPTLKYYSKPDKYIRLSWRKNSEDSEFTINTIYIRPIGKVISIFRKLTKDEIKISFH